MGSLMGIRGLLFSVICLACWWCLRRSFLRAVRGGLPLGCALYCIVCTEGGRLCLEVLLCGRLLVGRCTGVL